jgi:glucose-6-phosphate dehydrogenase assembly protein OpcA
LPLYLWWQGNLHPHPDPQLWSRIERLIIDSNTWTNPAVQFRILQEVEALGRTRCALCDLNWTRLFHLRYAMAQIFDLPAARQRLDRLNRVEITHAGGHRLTALQLLGWLASRLGWRLDQVDAAPVFRRRDGSSIAFALAEDQNAPSCVPAVHLNFDDATANVRREKTGDYYLVEFSAADTTPFAQMLPAGRERTSDILLSELSRVSRHPLFWPAIRAIEPLLG